MVEFLLILFLFTMYVIACIMDGPDVKPLWIKWVGRKLGLPEVEYIPIDRNVIHFYSHQLRCRKEINEFELCFSKRHQFDIIDQVKEECVHDLMFKIVPYVQFKIDTNPYDRNIEVDALLIVGGDYCTDRLEQIKSNKYE